MKSSIASHSILSVINFEWQLANTLNFLVTEIQAIIHALRNPIPPNKMDILLYTSIIDFKIKAILTLIWLFAFASDRSHSKVEKFFNTRSHQSCQLSKIHIKIVDTIDWMVLALSQNFFPPLYSRAIQFFFAIWEILITPGWQSFILFVYKWIIYFHGGSILHSKWSRSF